MNSVHRVEDGESLVVIVDDEPALCQATESLLRSAGFTAQSFASAEEFLRADCRESIRCLVLDIGLPGMSGLELQRHLAGPGSRLPIVFITAQYDTEGRTRELALRGGAPAFLHKPFGDDDLLGAVQSALDSEAAPREAVRAQRVRHASD